MIQISYTVATNKTAEKVFNFFRSLHKHYLRLSKGHKKFEISNAHALAKGVCINNEETVFGQTVTHMCQVIDFIENRCIKMVSPRSTATILKILKIPLKVTVEFTLESSTQNKTSVSSCVTLEFKNKFSELFARLLNTKRIWKSHLKEELENGLKIIESQPVDGIF